MGYTDDTGDQEVTCDNESGAVRLARVLHGEVLWIETIGIHTAANPLKATIPEYDNKRLNRGLYQDLLTYSLRQMKGRYGRMENPYVTANISSERLTELVVKYTQASVIFGQRDPEHDGIVFELISPFNNVEHQRTLGTLVSTRHIIPHLKEGPENPGDEDPKSPECKTGEHITKAKGQDGDRFYSEGHGHLFVIPFFDGNAQAAEFRRGRVLNYRKPEIPNTPKLGRLWADSRPGSAHSKKPFPGREPAAMPFTKGGATRICA